jgi:hypothetical protein
MSNSQREKFYRVIIPADACEVITVSPEIVAAVEAECGPLSQWDDLWCKCEDEQVSVDFRDDNECDCGVEKHHYHCTVCGGIRQIG